MKSAILMALLGASFFLAPSLSQAETLEEKLDARKQSFSAKADPQKRKDYDEGIRLVEQSGVLEAALNIGDKAPNFTLPNAAGEKVELESLLASGPVVMIWYRGEWCPYCNIQLEDIQSHIEEFKEAGAQVVAISPEKPDNGWSLQDRLNLEFHVLSDEGSVVAEEYGVVYTLPPKIAKYYEDAFDIHEKNGDDSNKMPIAAAYVIDQHGTVTYAYLDADYRKRAETSLLVEKVKALK